VNKLTVADMPFAVFLKYYYFYNKNNNYNYYSRQQNGFPRGYADNRDVFLPYDECREVRGLG
jgi:hypothetical protein